MERRNWHEISLPKSEKLARLGAAPWAQELTETELSILSDKVFICRVQAGEAIYKEGDSEAFMCLIAEGDVRISKSDGTLHPKILATLASGQTVGEMAIIDGEPRSASAMSITDSTLFVLSRLNLTELVHETPQIWSKLLLGIAAQLSQRLRATNNLLSEFTPNP